MDKFLRPSRFDCQADDPTAATQWTHWLRTFTNFVDSIPTSKKVDKLLILINCVSPAVFSYIAEETQFDEAIKTLESIFHKPKNEIYARHLLLNRKQQPNEDITQYLTHLRNLARIATSKV